MKKPTYIILLILFSVLACENHSQIATLRTDYLKIKIDESGNITSFQNITKKPVQEFSPDDKPSPLQLI